MQDYIERFLKVTRLQGEVIKLFVASVEPPIFYHSGKVHYGFRFAKPGAKHFCLLKAVRAVSGLNAAIALLDKGFTQELHVIIRTIVECTSQIDYIIAGFDNDNLKPPQKKFVDTYFSDFHRNNVDDFQRPRLRQGKVHETVGRSMREQLKGIKGGEKFSEVDASKLMSNVYLTYSNYVHSRYPEVMDMFGGMPVHFHLEGMRDTPKDAENIQQIECHLETVSLALRKMVRKFDMASELCRSPKLMEWFRVQKSDNQQQ